MKYYSIPYSFYYYATPLWIEIPLFADSPANIFICMFFFATPKYFSPVPPSGSQIEENLVSLQAIKMVRHAT